MFNLLFAMKKHGVTKIGASPMRLRTRVMRARPIEGRERKAKAMPAF